MMSEAEFLAGLTGRSDDLARVVTALRAAGQPFCLIGGLAVNHYVEPVVTLDADFAVVACTGVAEALHANGFTVDVHPHSLNAVLPGSRLRIQTETKPTSSASAKPIRARCTKSRSACSPVLTNSAPPPDLCPP